MNADSLQTIENSGLKGVLRGRTSPLNRKEVVKLARYIEYLRKSQMDRDYEELSVEETLKRHRKKLEEFTNRKRLNVEVILEEVVTGESLSERPKMLQALELVNTGEYDGIVCMDIDRLSRGSSFDTGYIMQVLQINNCKIITPDKTYDLNNESDEQFADMKFMFSRFEFKTISKRLVSGRNTSASEGKYLGSKPPYGYNIIKIKGDKGNTLEVIPEEAKVVQMIYDMYTTENIGKRTIAHRLNLLHIPTKTGKKWTETSVNNVLRNIVYTGKIPWKRMTTEKRFVDGKLIKKRKIHDDYEVHEGLHEAIITDEQYDLAQQIKSDRRVSPTKIGTEIKNPFGTIMFCEKCGSRIKFTTSSKKYKNTAPRFKCKEEGRSCDCKSTRAFEVEEVIVKEMRKWLDGYILTLDSQEIIPDNTLEEALERCQKELKDLMEQQDNICDLLEKKVYTIQMFTKRNTAIQEEIDTVNAAIKDLKDQIAHKLNTQVTEENIIPATQKLLDNYEMLTPKEKNDLWKVVLHKVTYYKGQTGGEFHITIYPKLNNSKG